MVPGGIPRRAGVAGWGELCGVRYGGHAQGPFKLAPHARGASQALWVLRGGVRVVGRTVLLS